MRCWSVWLLSFVCLFASSALTQEVITVPLVDKTSGGSPFEVSGRALLRERARANELEWSWGEKVVLKNVSGKPVLLFVASLTEVGRHAASAGRQGAPGNGSTYKLEDDRFFSERLVLPGESLTLRDTKPGTPDLACCINPLAQVSDPSAEYRMLFVQFADGSTFGDKAEAEDALAMRQTIMSSLRDLLQSYTDGGASGFVSRLREQSAFSATAICKQILSIYSDKGVRAALNETEHILSIAKQHPAVTTGDATSVTVNINRSEAGDD